MQTKDTIFVKIFEIYRYKPVPLDEKNNNELGSEGRNKAWSNFKKTINFQVQNQAIEMPP